MRSILVASVLGAILALSCSKDDGDKGDKGKKLKCAGASAGGCVTPAEKFQKSIEKVDRAIGKSVTPGLLPDGTPAEPLTQEQIDHFLIAYANALVYDNTLDALLKPARQQSVSQMVARMLEPVKLSAVGDLNDREKKMFDTLKARCAYGKRNESKREVGPRQIEITVDFFVGTGQGAMTCPLDGLTKELRNARVDQPNANTILTTGAVAQDGQLTVQEQALIDELGIVSRNLKVRASAEFTEVSRNKSTLISLNGTTEIEDRISGPYRLEAVLGSFEAVNDAGLEFFESKVALVYRMKGYTVLLQLFGTQQNGEAMNAKIFMNGRELKKEEAAKLRR